MNIWYRMSSLIRVKLPPGKVYEAEVMSVRSPSEQSKWRVEPSFILTGMMLKFSFVF